MDTCRVYGGPPFDVAVVHGGPGAPGTMAPVAKKLSACCGVLEPLQAMLTVDGLVEELRAQLESLAPAPAVLVGHSWGAWLSCMLASRHPSLVRKLILVGSGPFESHYAGQVMSNRLGRLEPEEREEMLSLLSMLSAPGAAEGDRLLARLGELTSRTDHYERVDDGNDPQEEIAVDGAAFQAVWREAAELRRSGALLDMAGTISCPVVAIHGEDDPHPADGIRLPLQRRLPHFSFHLLPRCGHYPWRERHAARQFYDLLKVEILAPA